MKRKITIVDKILQNQSSLHYIAIIEILIGVWQAGELSGAAVQVDIAGPKGGQETHFRLPCGSCGDMERHLTSL